MPRWQRAGRAVGDERHALFRETAVRAQRRIKAREVVLRFRAAEHAKPLRDDHEIADAVRWQLETRARFLARQHQLDARQRRETPARLGQALLWEIGGGERAECAVV